MKRRKREYRNTDDPWQQVYSSMRAASAGTGVPFSILKKLKHQAHPAFLRNGVIDMKHLAGELKDKQLDLIEDEESKLKKDILREKLIAARHENKIAQGKFISTDAHVQYLLAITGRIRTQMIQWFKTEWAPRFVGLTPPEIQQIMEADANRLMDAITDDIRKHVKDPC